MKGRAAFWIVTCFLAVLLSGCVTTSKVYVTLRDVPENPSFVVFPANNFLEQVEFASKIESSIIASGLKVNMRPATREVRTERDIGKIGTSTGSDMDTATARKIELYSEYEDTEAAYIVYTYATNGRVKIIKKETAEVLTIFQMYPHTTQPYADKEVYAVLKALGLPVREQENEVADGTNSTPKKQSPSKNW